MPLVQPFDRVRDHLVNYGLGTLLFPDYGGSLAHEERSGLIHGLIVQVVSKCLQIMLDRYYSLAREFSDLVYTILFPVLDIRVGAHSQWTALE